MLVFFIILKDTGPVISHLIVFSSVRSGRRLVTISCLPNQGRKLSISREFVHFLTKVNHSLEMSISFTD